MLYLRVLLIFASPFIYFDLMCGHGEAWRFLIVIGSEIAFLVWLARVFEQGGPICRGFLLIIGYVLFLLALSFILPRITESVPRIYDPILTSSISPKTVWRIRAGLLVAGLFLAYFVIRGYAEVTKTPRARRGIFSIALAVAGIPLLVIGVLTQTDWSLAQKASITIGFIWTLLGIRTDVPKIRGASRCVIKLR